MEIKGLILMWGKDGSGNLPTRSSTWAGWVKKIHNEPEKKKTYKQE